MISNNSIHLDKNQILLAVVDHEDLAQDLREHLLICPRCMEQRDAIESELTSFEQMAGFFAPLPRKHIALPAEIRPHSPCLWSRGVKAAFGLAAAATFVIFVMAEQGIFKITQPENQGRQTQELLQDEELSIEVRMLSENALPREYMDITAESEAAPGLDDGFMEFIAPSI